LIVLNIFEEYNHFDENKKKQKDEETINDKNLNSIMYIGRNGKELICEKELLRNEKKIFSSSLNHNLNKSLRSKLCGGGITSSSQSISSNEKIKMKKWKEKNYYFYLWLAYNILAIFPFELLAVRENEYILQKRRISLYKLNRMLRLLEAPRCIGIIFKILEEWLKVEVGPLRMWFMFFLMAVAAHWAACLFYMASQLDARKLLNRKRIDSTWGEIDGLWTCKNRTSKRMKIKFDVNLLHRYCRAYYWALVTMITTGFGDIVPITRNETVICILSMYIGMSITCGAIANLTLLVMSANQNQALHRSKIDAVRQYASYRHLPEQTMRKMVDFIEHAWHELRGVDENYFQIELPSSLRQRCAQFKLANLLQRLPSLANGLANAAFINALALKLSTSAYAPQDHVIRPGERLVGAILVSKGELEVRSRQSVEQSTFCSNTTYDLFSTSINRASFCSDNINICNDENKVSSYISNMREEKKSYGSAPPPNFEHIGKNDLLLAQNEAYCITLLGPGDNFGLDSLFHVTISKFLVLAHSYCEIVWLLRSVFMTVCREQCTTEQVEAMSNALRQRKRTNLRNVFHAGLGLQNEVDPLSVIHTNKLRKWSKIQFLDSQRKRLERGLRRVISIGSKTHLQIHPETEDTMQIEMNNINNHYVLSQRNNEQNNNTNVESMSITQEYDKNTPLKKEISTKTSSTIHTSPPLGVSTSPPLLVNQKQENLAWLIFRPGTTARDLLEAIKLFLLLFNAITIPLALKTIYSPSFKEKIGKKEYLFLASYVCDFLLIFDQILRFTVLPIQPKGILLTWGYQLRAHYWSSSSLNKKILLFLELASLLPWDSLAFMPPIINKYEQINNHLSCYAWLRILKIPYIFLRLPSQLQLVLTALPSIFSQQMQRIVVLNATMLLACHWIGCLWLLIGRISIRHYQSKNKSWIFIDRSITNYKFNNSTSSSDRTFLRNFHYDSSRWNHNTCSTSSYRSWCTYLRAIYFAIVAMSTVGYGDIRPDPSNLIETTFTSCVILFGGLMLPSVVGGLASLMSDLNKGIREYRAKLADMYTSMQRMKLRYSLQSALLQYHDYVWTRQKGVNELAVLNDLSAPMRRAVLNKTIGPAFLAAPFFSQAAGVEDVAREELVARLEPRVFLPGDVILAEGDLSRLSMFLIERGCVDLFSAKAGLKAIDEARAKLLQKLELARAHQSSSLIKNITTLNNSTNFLQYEQNKDKINLPSPKTHYLNTAVSASSSLSKVLTFPKRRLSISQRRRNSHTISSSVVHGSLETKMSQRGTIFTVSNRTLNTKIDHQLPIIDQISLEEHVKKKKLSVDHLLQSEIASKISNEAATRNLSQDNQNKRESASFCTADSNQRVYSNPEATIDIIRTKSIDDENILLSKKTSSQSPRSRFRRKTEPKLLSSSSSSSNDPKIMMMTRQYHQYKNIGDDQFSFQYSKRRRNSASGVFVSKIWQRRSSHHELPLWLQTHLASGTNSNHLVRGSFIKRNVNNNNILRSSRKNSKDIHINRRNHIRKSSKESIFEIINQKPVLKALCVPVMRRHAGDYFGAECLLETNSTYHDMPQSKWSNALKFALEIPKNEGGNKKNLFLTTRALINKKENEYKQLEAKHLKCAPQMSTVANSYTDCYELHRAQFYDVLRGFPSSATVIKKELQYSCNCESRRIKAVVQNIARIHFSKQFARRVKYNNESDCFRYETAMEDEYCKLALYPEALSTVATRSMRRGGSQLLDEAYGGLRRSALKQNLLGENNILVQDFLSLKKKKNLLHAQNPINRNSGGENNNDGGYGPSRRGFFAGSAHNSPKVLNRSTFIATPKSKGEENVSFSKSVGTNLLQMQQEETPVKNFLLRFSNILRDIGSTRKKKQKRSMLKAYFEQIEFTIRRLFCDPESLPCIWWSGIMVIAILYQIVSTPLHVAFLPRNNFIWRYLMDWIMDFICIIDILLRTFIIGYIHHGRLIVDQKLIIEHEFKSGALIFNLIISIPYDFFAFLFSYEWQICILALSRLPKFLRFLRLNKLMYAARSLSGAIEARIGNRKATLMRLLGSVLLFSHVAACAFYGIARYNSVTKPNSLKKFWRCTWIRAQISDGFLKLKVNYNIQNLPNQYLRALNWSLPTLVVVVIGDVTPSTCKETLFVFFTIAIGMSVNAMIIGQVVAVVANSNASSTELSIKADRLEKYLQQHKIPYNLKYRINSFMNSLQMTSESIDPIFGTKAGNSLAQSTLPHTLRARICLALRLPVLNRCPIFLPCSEVLKKSIALYLTPEIYSAGDLIVEYGDRGEAMYFLIQGTVQVIAENGITIYATLKAGTFFGEGALFANIRRMASIQCTGFSESLRLTRIDVQNQLRAFCLDQQLLLNKFNTITKRNKDRNDAIQKNLKLAQTKGSRLHRLMHISNEEQDLQKLSPIERAVKLSSNGGNTSYIRQFGIYVAQILMNESSQIRALWHIVLTILALYSAIIIPYRTVFTLPSELNHIVPNKLWQDYFFDLFFISSIILRLLIDDLICILNDDNNNDEKTNEMHKQNTPTTNLHPKKKYSLSLLFKFDILAELPFEFLFLLATRRWKYLLSKILNFNFDHLIFTFGHNDRHLRNLLLAARLNRMLRLIRIKQYFDECTRYLALKFGLRLSVADKALVTIILGYWMCNHWYACIWFAIHRYYEAKLIHTWATVDSLAIRFHNDDMYSTTTANKNDDNRVCQIDIFDCYLRSFYMVITTISSVGYGDIKPLTPIETIWQLIVVITGACLFASLIGAFTLFLEEVDTEGWSAFHAKLQRYEAYMRRSNFPSDLRIAILQHHHHRFAHSLCINEKSLTKELTAPLRMDLVLYIHRKAFKRIHLLASLPTSTARRIADVLTTQICLRNEYVYSAGEVNFDIYFIFAGTVHLVPPSDEKVLDAQGRQLFRALANEKMTSSSSKTIKFSNEIEDEQEETKNQSNNEFDLPPIIYHPSEQKYKKVSPFKPDKENSGCRPTFDSISTNLSSHTPHKYMSTKGSPTSVSTNEQKQAAEQSTRRSRSVLISRETIGKLQQRDEDSDALNIQSFSTLIQKDLEEKIAHGGELYIPIRGILQQGDHFGEYCLHFDSGIRQESALALATLELYTVSRRDLEDQVLNFESDDALQLINDLLQHHPTLSSSSSM